MYTPHQHTARPLGYEHRTVFAKVELYDDDPPESIKLGELDDEIIELRHPGIADVPEVAR